LGGDAGQCVAAATAPESRAGVEPASVAATVELFIEPASVAVTGRALVTDLPPPPSFRAGGEPASTVFDSLPQSRMQTFFALELQPAAVSPQLTAANTPTNPRLRRPRICAPGLVQRISLLITALIVTSRKPSAIARKS
jgi:hypothetical protein